MVDVTRRDLMAATATVAIGSRATGTVSGNDQGSTDCLGNVRDDEAEPKIVDPNSTLALSTSAALTLKRINWDEVPEITAEEGEWFRERLFEAPIEPEGGRDE